jgi:hypothetical protein
MKRLLFDTWLGDKLLALFERITGLALVDAAEVSERRAPVLP